MEKRIYYPRRNTKLNDANKNVRFFDWFLFVIAILGIIALIIGTLRIIETERICKNKEVPYTTFTNTNETQLNYTFYDCQEHCKQYGGSIHES